MTSTPLTLRSTSRDLSSVLSRRPRSSVWLALAVAGSAACTIVPTVTRTVVPLRTEPVGSEPALDKSAQFGSLFCGVLIHLGPAEGWGYCDRYFAPVGSPTPVTTEIVTPYRLLVVPGIFGQCVEAIARPFEDASIHLLAVHHVSVEYLSVSALGGTAYNARQIDDYFRRQLAGADQRPYVVFGYSKGTSDLLEAIAAYDVVRSHVAGLVTIAGSVLGSRLTEGLPTDILNSLRDTRIGSCDGGDGKGLESLQRDERARALAVHRLPLTIRAYSIAAVSDEATTSNVLMSSWHQLNAYSLEEDSQMIQEDAIIPGSTYLGIARGDHWAVALPFEHAAQTHPEFAAAIATLINRNHYPRTALFEAALRFVLDDLASDARAAR
jgi:hypothetical protein